MLFFLNELYFPFKDYLADDAILVEVIHLRYVIDLYYGSIVHF